MKLLTVICVFAILCFSTRIYADEEEPNRPIVFTGQQGKCYAKSIPDSILGVDGKTRIYSFEGWNDKLLHEYRWYSSELYLGGDADRTIVRLFSWYQGHEPSDKQIAIGIYRDGKTIREYSTKHIVELGLGIKRTVSHYIVFGKRVGFKWNNGYSFNIEGVSGKVFQFRLDTGDIIQ